MKPDGPHRHARSGRWQPSPLFAGVVTAVHAILEADPHPTRSRGVDDDGPDLRRRWETDPEDIPAGFAPTRPVQSGSALGGRGAFPPRGPSTTNPHLTPWQPPPTRAGSMMCCRYDS